MDFMTAFASYLSSRLFLMMFEVSSLQRRDNKAANSGGHREKTHAFHFDSPTNVRRDPRNATAPYCQFVDDFSEVRIFAIAFLVHR